MTDRADLPTLDSLPIPDDVAVGATWPASMVEMADHIGVRDTLRVSEAKGGQDIYISSDPARSPFADILTDAQIATIAHVYGGSRYIVPTAAKELRAARRAGVLAAVRAKELSVADAAKVCGSTRRYIAHLVNQTSAGQGAVIPAALPRRNQADPRQIDLFDRPDAYPCQPFSTSGRRRGEDDPRHLWPHVARVVEEAEPEWVFCENVEGHLDLGFADVCRQLQGMGFAVAAGVFAAGEVGAPHLRRRMFLLAHADRGSAGVCSRYGGDGRAAPNGFPVEPATGKRGAVQSHTGDCLMDGPVAVVESPRLLGPFQPDRLFAPGPDQLHAWEGILADRPDLQPSVLGMDDGMADWLDRNRGAGNGVCSLVAALAFRTLRASFTFDLPT